MIDVDTPIAVAGFELTVAEPLAPDARERAAIAACWRAAQAATPQLWNGSFFLFEAVGVVDGRLRATARPTSATGRA